MECKPIFLAILLCCTIQCTIKSQQNEKLSIDSMNLVDYNCNKPTKLLYSTLKAIKGKNVIFGQQDAFIFSYNTKFHSFGKCDVYDVCGDYPALIGWDFGWLDSKSELNMLREQMLRSYNLGIINTASFHMDNPVTGKDCKDTTLSVREILKPGKYNNQYNKMLDRVADFVLNLKDSSGYALPFIFRPFHEHTGNWFWWGQSHCSGSEFIELWRYTVKYLRDTKGVHNFLYAYSPDTVANATEYLERYPGDEYVDIMGIDIYRDVEANNINTFIKRLQIVANTAETHHKLAALTETGYSDHTQINWWTNFLLKALKNDSLTRTITYVMPWANYRNDHFFSIYPGHFNANNFRDFEKDDFTLFLKDWLIIKNTNGK